MCVCWYSGCLTTYSLYLRLLCIISCLCMALFCLGLSFFDGDANSVFYPSYPIPRSSLLCVALATGIVFMLECVCVLCFLVYFYYSLFLLCIHCVLSLFFCIFFLFIRRLPRFTLFHYTMLFRSIYWKTQDDPGTSYAVFCLRCLP